MWAVASPDPGPQTTQEGEKTAQRVQSPLPASGLCIQPDQITEALPVTVNYTVGAKTTPSSLSCLCHSNE